jgi:hypothetical protein
MTNRKTATVQLHANVPNTDSVDFESEESDLELERWHQC